VQSVMIHPLTFTSKKLFTLLKEVPKQGASLTLLTRVLMGAGLIALFSFPALGGQWTPDPSLGNVAQHSRLYDIGRKFGDTNFDNDANLVGIHTKSPPNKKSHSTRESTYYAYGLLLTGDPHDRARAQSILKRIVTFQDTKPDSPTYGIFNWNSEDPPSDLNSAAFVGLTLADIIDLDRRRPCLDPDLRSQVEAAARLALGEVIHRNVDPGYTNIALLSIAFASAGDKLWVIPGAGAWAQTKLDAVMGLARDGEFAEYLSPTYYGVSLQGAYMARKFAFSEAFAAKVDATIDHLWKQTAASYHAPTFQLAGPHLRSYGDDMLRYAALLKYFLYLGLDGAYPLPDNDFEQDWDKGGIFTIADLPIGARPEFRVPPVAWRQWNAVGSGNTPVRSLSQYREGNFILGTVAFQDEYLQKRNLVAYWRSAAPDGFRVSFCIDKSNESIPGFAGEKLHFYSQQERGAALVAIVGSTDIPGQGSSSLVFDGGATVVKAKDSLPLRIQDGTITAYLYPVSPGVVHFESKVDIPHHVLQITRPWNSSDIVGSLHVLSYLVVFRPSGQPAPTVSGLFLEATASGVSARAEVDGAPLSVQFKN
jgi:hypothetical protein